MPVDRRTLSKLLAFTLALPVFLVVYVTTFGGRLWAALRPAVATFLGATVITSVYAGEAYRRAPATPMRAAAVLALAVALVAPGMGATPVAAAADPAEAVIAAAQGYLGAKFRLGTEGPRTFDCSGLIYRVFSDAGELPRIGGMRLRAAGYMRWFVSRGLFTKNEAEARRGDLVVWNNGKHIGIYLGNGKALSALVNPWGISTHSIRAIKQEVSYFLKVNWGRGDGNGEPGDGGGKPPGDGPGEPPGDGAGKPEDQPGDGAGKPEDQPGDGGGKPEDQPGDNGDGRGNSNPGNANSNGNGNNAARPDGMDAFATGTMNLRQSADPSARVIGWIGRGGSFKIVGEGSSPAGYLWFEIETKSGKHGWVYSRWVQKVN